MMNLSSEKNNRTFGLLVFFQEEFRVKEKDKVNILIFWNCAEIPFALAGEHADVWHGKEKVHWSVRGSE